MYPDCLSFSKVQRVGNGIVCLFTVPNSLTPETCFHSPARQFPKHTLEYILRFVQID